MAANEFSSIEDSIKVGGVIVVEGVKITLTTHPTLDYHRGEQVYGARGEDKDGNELCVIWHVLSEYKNGGMDFQADESNACDWSKPLLG